MAQTTGKDYMWIQQNNNQARRIRIRESVRTLELGLGLSFSSSIFSHFTTHAKHHVLVFKTESETILGFRLLFCEVRGLRKIWCFVYPLSLLLAISFVVRRSWPSFIVKNTTQSSSFWLDAPQTATLAWLHLLRVNSERNGLLNSNSNRAKCMYLINKAKPAVQLKNDARATTTEINRADFVSGCMLYTYESNKTISELKRHSWENDTVLSCVNH